MVGGGAKVIDSTIKVVLGCLIHTLIANYWGAWPPFPTPTLSYSYTYA